MTDPKITTKEAAFKTDFETLLNKSDLPDGMKEALLKNVEKTVAEKGEANPQKLQLAIDQGAMNYIQAMQGDLQRLREKGTFYKPLYQTPPNNGANATLFQVMDSVKNLNQQQASLGEEGDVQRAILAFKPQAAKLIKSSFSK